MYKNTTKILRTSGILIGEPLWLTGKAAKSSKNKCWAWQRFRSTGSYEDYVKFTRKRYKTQMQSYKL